MKIKPVMDSLERRGVDWSWFTRASTQENRWIEGDEAAGDGNADRRQPAAGENVDDRK